MTSSTQTRPAEVTPEQLIANARALRDLVRDQAAAAEERGHYLPEVHAAFVRAGFYHMLTPARYGGFETDLATFAKVVIEIGRADPGTAWCLCLGHGHALTTAARWSEQAQDEVFGTDRGYFRASHSLVPAGTATPVEGGYLINARSPYQSGVPYSTHATVNVRLDDGSDDMRFLQVLVPESQFTVLDDWGGDATIGMRASGSNTVVVDNQVVPRHYAAAMDWLAETEVTTSLGVRLHGNPMYLGLAQGFLNLELVACVVGAARAALDEYEVLLRTKTNPYPPREPRYQSPSFQRDFGLGKMKADSAESLTLHVAAQYMAWCKDTVDGVRPFSRSMDIELFGMLVQAGQMACEVVELLFRSAGSSAATRGQRMQRYLRDVAMYRGHTSAQHDALAQRIAAVNLGEATSVF